jgi:hypothetical protein
MRNNFNVHEWRIDQIRKENQLSIKDISSKQDKMVDAVASAISKNFDIPKDGGLTGTIRVALADFIEEGITEGWNDKVEEIEMIYTTNGDLYSIKVNGEKQRGTDLDSVKQLIIDATGFDINTDQHVGKVAKFMKGLGIDVSVGEIDVS